MKGEQTPMAIRESELSTLSSISTSDYVRSVAGGASSKVKVSDLAKTTLEEYSGSKIAGANQSVKAAVDSLDAQFQELIAPTGEAPNPAEIENARVGADGNTYANLGTAIRTQILERTEADLALQNSINAESARAAAEEARIEALFTQPVEDAVSDWLDEHPEATTTVEDGSLTEAKMANSLKTIVSSRKGSALSLNRIASLIKTSDRYSGEDPTNYWYPQSTCTDGTSSYVVAFISAASGQGNNDKVTLRMYNNSHVLQKSAMVAVNHCNDMTYYDGKIYATNYGGQSEHSSQYSVAIIDYSTLELIEYIDLPNTLSLIDYHDGYFYTSNAHNLIKYDTDFTEISRVTLDEPTNRTAAHFGLTVTDNCVYLCNGYPNSIEKYHLDGSLEGIFNIGYLNGDFTVGEGEGLFYSEPLGGYVYTAGAYAGYLTPSVYTQHFLIDFDSNTVDGIKSDAHRTYSNYTTLYVDATNTDANPDGSSTNPYREINEALFNAIGAITAVKISVAEGEYESISTMFNGNVSIEGSDKSEVTIKGANLTNGGNVTIAKVTFETPAALTAYGKRALVVAFSTCCLSDVAFDCESCDNAIFVDRGTLISLGGLALGNTVSYCVRAQYSDITIASATYPSSKTILYANVCRLIKPDTMPFYNNSINYQWPPFKYSLSTATGAVGAITLPGWITNFLTDKKFRKVGVIVYVNNAYRQIISAPVPTGFVGGTFFDPADLTKIYCIQVSVDSELRISVNGYYDMTDGTWHTDTTHLLVEGLVFE